MIQNWQLMSNLTSQGIHYWAVNGDLEVDLGIQPTYSEALWALERFLIDHEKYEDMI